MSDDDIDVRFEAPQDDPIMRDGRPMLTWAPHPKYVGIWTLWYLVGDDGADDYRIPGDLTDVDYAVEQARKHLRSRRDGALDDG